MIIQGKRLNFTGLERENIKDRHTWLCDPDITRYFTNLGSTPISEADMMQWFENVSHKKTEEIHFAVWTNHLQHIGGAQLKSIDWRNRSCEFGIFIGAKDQWGKGYGTEATYLLLKYAFLTLNLHRIWLRVDSGNIGAIKCYQKCGFIQEGIFREEVYRDGAYHDSIVMSILKTEYDLNLKHEAD